MASTILIRDDKGQVAQPAIIFDAKEHRATIAVPYLDVKIATPGAPPLFVSTIEFWVCDTLKGQVLETWSEELPFRTVTPAMAVNNDVKGIFYFLCSDGTLAGYSPEYKSWEETDREDYEYAVRVGKNVTRTAPYRIHAAVDVDDIKSTKIHLLTPSGEGNRELKDSAGLLKYLAKTVNPTDGFNFMYVKEVDGAPIFYLPETESLYYLEGDLIKRIHCKYNSASPVDGGILFTKLNSSGQYRCVGIPDAMITSAIKKGGKELTRSLKQSKPLGFEPKVVDCIGVEDTFVMSENQMEGDVSLLAYSIMHQSFISIEKLAPTVLDENFLLVANEGTEGNVHINRIVFIRQSQLDKYEEVSDVDGNGEDSGTE